MPELWLDPRLEVRRSRLHGHGTYALERVIAGEVVTIWGHRILTADEVDEAPPGEMVTPRGDGTFVWLPPYDREAPDHFLNHSCDPNTWLTDEVTLVARRLIGPGEELTADYGTFELKLDFVGQFACRCGPGCRGRYTGRDWQLPELQTRYDGHWHPVLAHRIAEAGPKLRSE